MGPGVCQWRRTKVNRCRNVERIRTSSKPGCHDYPGIRLEVPVLKAGCIKNPDTGHPCWKDRPVCCPTGDRYVGGVNVAQASIRNLGTCMPMQREKSKRKNRKDQNTDTECRGGTTRSSDESSQWGRSEGVVLSRSVHGTTERDEPGNRAKLD